MALLFATISFGQVKSIDERIGEAMNGSNWAIKYGKEILEKYQEELNSSVPSIMYFMAEDYATLGHYDKGFRIITKGHRDRYTGSLYRVDEPVPLTLEVVGVM